MTYETWIDDALRGVVRRAFEHACTHGLPGDHHFYVTFRTDAEGVDIPSRLREQHPEQMTIVLQHQFWDLSVEDEAFSVTLKFRGRSERLRISFAAVTAFADPAVNFGLQFKLVPLDDTVEDGADAEQGEDLAVIDDGEPAAPLVSAGRPKGDEAQDSETVPDNETSPGGSDRGSGQVIVLDSFRKT